MRGCAVVIWRGFPLYHPVWAQLELSFQASWGEPKGDWRQNISWILSLMLVKRSDAVNLPLHAHPRHNGAVMKRVGAG